MARARPNLPAAEPLPLAVPELATPAPAGSHTGLAPIRRIGRLRIPLAGPFRPWATLYELPEGKEIWCLGLWELDRPVRRCVSTSTLLAYARRSGLRRLERDVLALTRREV